LRAATDAPLDVMRACLESIRDAAVVAELGNRNASSDVLVGLELLEAGLRGARLNVEINLGSVKDQAWVDGVRAEVQQLESDASTAVEDARRHLMTA
jgi:formiminotetrahydrofolate cyclodeaminase